MNQVHYPPPLDPIPKLLYDTGWVHSRSNCPCKGTDYHSVFSRKRSALYVYWNADNFKIDNFPNQIIGKLNELYASLTIKN